MVAVWVVAVGVVAVNPAGLLVWMMIVVCVALCAGVILAYLLLWLVVA